MRPAIGIIRGPSLFRHDCRQCGPDELHNARGCCRCGTQPWTTPVQLNGSARTVARMRNVDGDGKRLRGRYERRG